MKNITLAIAVLALLAGCKKNDGGKHKDSDLISLNASTRRAAEATIFNLQDNGFVVWATANGVTGWYDDIAGIEHIYTSGTWDFATPKPWPTDAGQYPVHFYALYPPATPAAALPGALPGEQSIAVDFTVASTAASQVDLLGARSTANIKPADGNLAIEFEHLLSKVDFGLRLGIGFSASVQGLTVNNVGNRGTYTLLAAAPSWTTPPATYTTTYTYYGTIYPAGQNSGKTAPLANTTYDPQPDGTSPTPFYDELSVPKASEAHLMLMPQVKASQQWGGGSAPAGVPTTESFVSLVYRLRQSGHDLIGFEHASSHPAFDGSALQAGGYPSNSPLFVKVGYPFDLNWVLGKGYIYNIDLTGGDGMTGGYLIDQNYYDDKGNRTDLVVGDTDGDGDGDGGQIPDPIIDGDNIHLIPIVGDWEEGEGGDLN